MAQTPVDKDKLKELFKTAIVEVLEERRELFRDLLEEALEDLALGHAIEEGVRTETVSREKIFSMLEGGR